MALIFLKVALVFGGVGLISLLYFITIQDDPWKGFEIFYVCSIAAALAALVAISLAVTSSCGC